MAAATWWEPTTTFRDGAAQLKQPAASARRLSLGAALASCAFGACGGDAPPVSMAAQKPTIVQAWAAAKLPQLPRTPVIPARRTNVLPVPPRQGAPDDPALVALGKRIFFDARLSEPPGTSCASCHDPARAFSGGHGSSVGVPLGSRPGHFARRSTPSVLYLRYTPRFHFFEDDENPAPEPRGGFFWDGRADTIAALVRQPLFNPDEMNAGTPTRLARKIARAPYAAAFRDAFGSSVEAGAVLRGVGAALQAFLESDDMTPASSKYDAYARGQATLTEAERRGLEVFKDRRRGACAGCHRMAETSSNPADSMFTDYGYDAVGLPRNHQLGPNRNPAAFDSGPLRAQGRAHPLGRSALLFQLPHAVAAERGRSSELRPQRRLHEPPPGAVVLREPGGGPGAGLPAGPEIR